MGIWVGTLIMGGLLVAVVLATLRGRDWKHYTPTIAPEETDRITALMGSTTSWILLYVLAVLGLGVGALVLASGGEFVPVDAGVAWSLLRGVLGVLVVGYIVLGTYFTLRSRGRASAQAAGVSLLLLGALFLLGLSLQLVGTI